MIPQVSGGWIQIAVYIAGNISGTVGPTSERTVALTKSAGSPHRVDELLQVFPRAGFLANGAVTITFPIPFPNVCLHVDPVPVSASVTGASVNAWLNAQPTKTGATINGRSFTSLLGVLNIGLGSFDVKWHAIGN